MYSQNTIEEFLSNTASKTPLVPSGGSVLGLCGALAAALTELVVNTTIDKKGYEEVHEEMINIQAQLLNYRRELTEDIDRDADAYSSDIRAFRMPKSTEDEKEARIFEIEKNYKEAVKVPIELAERTLRMLEVIKLVLRKGNKNAYGDAYTASLIGKAVIKGSIGNARHNLNSIKDEKFRKETIVKTKGIEEKLAKLEI